MISILDRTDIFVFLLLTAILVYAGVAASLRRKDAEAYFMADRKLKWWSVAGSIYGTNVSLSQIIGMLGIGYSIGFAQSHYEVLAIPAILLLCYVFIPVYRRRGVFTLSEYLGHRYGQTARLLYTVIIISVIVILLVGGLYIGSRQLGLLFSGTVLRLSYLQGILLIAAIACLLIFFGGMESVVAAENIITVLMVLAVVVVGICTLWQPEIGGLSGLLALDASADRGMQKMHLYLPSDHPDLPWTGVFSGLMVLHGFFWTTNQFEVQRILAAGSDRQARLGAIAAGFLKLTIPFFSIAAGVAAAYLFRYKYRMDDVKPDDAFIMLMSKVVPSGYGLTGLILAGFTGAIFSSIYSMLNSASTLLAMDVYRKYIDPQADDRRLVVFGKLSVVVICLLSCLLAWLSFDPRSDGNFFLTLSRNTSYLKPGIVSAFFLGVCWKRAHPVSAVAAIIAAPLLSFGIEWVYADFLSEVPWLHARFGAKLNFLHRVFIVFLLCVLLQVCVSVIYQRRQPFLPETPDVTASLGGLSRTILWIGLLHAFFLLLIHLSVMGPATAALPAAGCTCLVFLLRFFREYRRGHPDHRNLFGSDLTYAGLLAGAAVWVLYRFA